MQKLFFIPLLLFNTVLMAQVHTYDLYEGRVPIVKYNDINAQENLRQALTQVIVQLSGEAKKPFQPMVQERLGNINSLIENYTYQVVSETGKRMLVVHFDKTKMNNMLLELGLPHWPSYISPSLLGWIDVEEEFFSEHSEEAEQLKNQTLQRGVTLFFPLFDIEDIAVLKPSDQDAKIKTAVAKIIQRYGIPHVLVGEVSKSSEAWQSQWHLYLGSEEINFHYDHLQRSILFTEAINRTIDEMVQYYATTVSSMGVEPTREELELLVTELPSLQEYVQIRDYLKRLPPVIAVQVFSIQRKQAKFRVSVEGGKKALLQAISLGNVLILEQDMIFRLNKIQ